MIALVWYAWAFVLGYAVLGLCASLWLRRRHGR
jgi:hypothetical protein